MFSTHETASWGIPGLFQEGYTQWRMVERHVQAIWYHVTLEVTLDGEERSRTLMPDDISLLMHLVEQQTLGIRIKEVQIVTPACVNGSEDWRMEILEKIEIKRYQQGDVVILHHIHNGAIYADPAVHTPIENSCATFETIYQRT